MTIVAALVHFGAQNVNERLDLELKLHPLSLKLGEVRLSPNKTKFDVR